MNKRTLREVTPGFQPRLFALLRQTRGAPARFPRLAGYSHHRLIPPAPPPLLYPVIKPTLSKKSHPKPHKVRRKALSASLGHAPNPKKRQQDLDCYIFPSLMEVWDAERCWQRNEGPFVSFLIDCFTGALASPFQQSRGGTCITPELTLLYLTFGLQRCRTDQLWAPSLLSGFLYKMPF